MAFIQLIEFSTSKPEEVQQLGERWRSQTQGKRTTTRSLACLDRDTPGRYVLVAEFASYESAMENSNLPETEEFAAQLLQLIDGPPTFRNLEVMVEYPEP
jgi:quinol monooxygenase YgiN